MQYKSMADNGAKRNGKGVIFLKGAGAKRARRNSSLLDAHILKPGEDTEDIPDSYVIFITENDVMKGNLFPHLRVLISLF